MQPAISSIPRKGWTQSRLPTSNNESEFVLGEGRYVTKYLIGSGSYASVYLATSVTEFLNKDNHVALKVSKKKASSIILGKIEASVLIKLNPHKNIVNLLDFSIHDDEVCLALELGDCSLNKLVGLWGREKLQLSIGQLNFFLVELLEAYLYIESKGLLNNTDLSDGNVLYFKNENRLKLSDFGVDWDGSSTQSKIGRLAHYVLTRLSHNCDALPYHGRAAFCSDNVCKKVVLSNKLDLSHLDWRNGLDQSHTELIINLSKGIFSTPELTDLLNELSNNLELLPVPETLIPGEELKPFDWERYYSQKELMKP